MKSTGRPQNRNGGSPANGVPGLHRTGAHDKSEIIPPPLAERRRISPPCSSRRHRTRALLLHLPVDTRHAQQQRPKTAEPPLDSEQFSSPEYWLTSAAGPDLTRSKRNRGSRVSSSPRRALHAGIGRTESRMIVTVEKNTGLDQYRARDFPNQHVARDCDIMGVIGGDRNNPPIISAHR